MAQKERTQRYASIVSLYGGMSQALDPLLLQDNEYVFGANLSSRKGMLQSRPGFDHVLTAGIPTGKFQGAARYHLTSGDRLVMVIAGEVLSYNVDTDTLTSFGILLDTTVDVCHFCQADRYMIIQDGVSGSAWADANWPVILHGDALVDQSAEDDAERVPKGGPMAYGHGRLFVTVNYVYEASAWSDDLGQVGFVAGDVIKAYEPESVLKFTEEEYLNEGGRIVMPQELGIIKGMVFQRNVMNGVGQGPLIVGAEEGFSAFQVNAPRSEWKDIDFGVVLFSGTGSVSPRSFVNFNEEVFFRAKDGARALIDTARKLENGGIIVNRSLTGPVQSLLELDTLATQEKASIAVVGNRMFLTVNPDTTGFKGLLALDLMPIPTIEQSGSTFDGVWTGFEFHQVLMASSATADQLYAFVRTEAGTNAIYRLNDDSVNDAGTSIVSRVQTKAYAFGDFFTMKQLNWVEVWLSDVQGDVELSGYYRADKYPLWSSMNAHGILADSTGFSHIRRRLRFAPVSVMGDIGTGMNLDIGAAFEFCLEWTGHAQVEKVLMSVSDHTSQHIGSRDESTRNKIEEQSGVVDLDLYDYKVI